MYLDYISHEKFKQVLLPVFFLFDEWKCSWIWCLLCYVFSLFNVLIDFGNNISYVFPDI